MDDPEHCNEYDDGVQVTCQREDPTKDHYGNACVIGHTGKFKNN